MSNIRSLDWARKQKQARDAERYNQFLIDAEENEKQNKKRNQLLKDEHNKSVVRSFRLKG